MSFDTILFDLDGTLTDSAPGILNCMRYALTKMGREIPDETVLNSFLGPPLLYTFRTFCGMTDAEAEKAAGIYRSRYKDSCVTENSLYDGIEEMLEKLQSAGKTLAVATTKPEPLAEKIISHFGIRPYFKAVCGASPDVPDGGKAGVIRKALSLCGTDDLSTAVMVGDRFYDIDGAKEAGIASIGALFGYSKDDELEKAGADFTAATPDEIVKIILE